MGEKSERGSDSQKTSKNNSPAVALAGAAQAHRTSSDSYTHAYAKAYTILQLGLHAGGMLSPRSDPQKERHGDQKNETQHTQQAKQIARSHLPVECSGCLVR